MRPEDCIWKPAVRRICLLLLLLFLPGCYGCCHAEMTDDRGFSVQRIGQMICNGDNAFSVEAPEDGTFSITIYDDVCRYRIIRESVSAGINEIRWDGCGYNGEQLDTKYYNFDFRLEGASGEIYRYFFRSPIVENAQHLQFVLPSSGTACSAVPEEWFVEIKAVRNGSVIFEILKENEPEPVHIAERTVHTGRVEHFTFENIFGRSKPDAGEYSVKVYERSRPDEVTEFALRILSGLPEVIPVSVTGEIMPSGNADDSQIWDAMMKPSVVVDIDPHDHQKVYSEPDTSSASLGTLHGQSQGLAVLEMQEGWARIGAWNHESADYVEGWVPLERLKVVEPNTEYGILINKQKQTMTVYRKGERIETLLVSTGRMDPGKFDRETSAGCFLSGLHRVDFSTQGLKYDFVIQYDGGNLLHQIPYSSDGRKDFTQGKAYLGSKASHACIRIQDKPGEQNGINAYWLWTHLPYRTRIIILDDPEERAAEKARLSGSTPVDAYGSLLVQQNNQENTIVLTFAGDIFPVFTEDSNGFDAVHSEKGAGYHFERLQEIFGKDDLTCVSLGCALKEDPSGEDTFRRTRWRGMPSYAEMFEEGSVEMVSLGNDHLYDFTQSGYDSTVDALENKVFWTGKDHRQTAEIKGRVFGFSTVSQQDYLADTAVISREVRSLRDSGCDYVIMQCHWGNERDGKHGKLQEAMARTCAREGADLVIGYQPYAVQGIFRIEGMPVVWGLGSLLRDNSVRQKTYDTLAVQVLFDSVNKEKRPVIRLIPLLSSSSAAQGENDYRPAPAEKDDSERILNLIQADTGFRIQFK